MPAVRVKTLVKQSENDHVVLGYASGYPVEINFNQLVLQRNNRISFQVDLLDITFVEK